MSSTWLKNIKGDVNDGLVTIDPKIREKFNNLSKENESNLLYQFKSEDPFIDVDLNTKNVCENNDNRLAPNFKDMNQINRHTNNTYCNGGLDSIND
jgi:hypothetical protein